MILNELCILASTFLRYFVTNTTWSLKEQTAWLDVRFSNIGSMEIIVYIIPDFDGFVI